MIVDGNHNEEVGGDRSLNVNGALQGKAANVRLEAGLGGEVAVKAGGKIIIEATQQISLKGPGGFIDIGAAGVTIQGTMVKINSGGAAGSGGACSPTAPEQADPAEPITPDTAHDSTTGFKSNY